MERVDSFKYLGVHITKGLTWLRRLRKFQLSHQILNHVYYIIDSILMGNITAWYANSTEQDRNALQRVVYLADHTIGSAILCLKNIYTRH